MKEVDFNSKNSFAALQEAIDVLNKGGVIVYPTETSYGLGGDFFNDQVAKKIYQIKKRDANKPLPVIVPDLMTATTLVEFPERALRLATEHWPGPLNLVLPYRYCNINNCQEKFLSVRVSSHPFVSDLLMHFGTAIISTSANVSGSGDCYRAEDIREQFKNAAVKPDLFVNFGYLPKNEPSTTIKIDHENNMEILRQGGLKI